MQVYSFDPITGTKGDYICDIPRVDAMGVNGDRPECVLPKWGPDYNWMVANYAKDRQNRPVTFDRPVCFCVGKWYAGEDASWEWVALLPA